MTTATAPLGSVEDDDGDPLVDTGVSCSDPGDNAEFFGLHEHTALPHFILHLMEAINVKNDTTIFTTNRMTMSCVFDESPHSDIIVAQKERMVFCFCYSLL